MANQLERIVELAPAYDRRDPDPSKNYGFHGVDLRMILKGPLGVVQFVVHTNWQLPHVRAEQDRQTLTEGIDRIGLKVRYHPSPADVGYHSPHAMYGGQEPMSDGCPYVDGGTCYYDGSGLRAVEWFETIFLTEGSDGIWTAMEAEYRELFEAEEVPA